MLAYSRTGVDGDMLHVVVGDKSVCGLLLVCVHLHPHSVQNGSTALCVAAQEGHLRVVELLIAAKADVNIQTNVSHIGCSSLIRFMVSLLGKLFHILYQ